MQLQSLAKFNVAVSLLAGLTAGISLLVISSKYGLALSPDSVCYISIAENLLKGNGFAIYDLQPVADWPPLYPALLAIGSFLKISFVNWAQFLNIILYALLVFVSARWITDKVTNRWLALVGVIAILFSLPLIYVAKYAWSETLFTLFLILFLVRLEKSFPNHTFKNVAILAMLTALAIMSRYIAITMVLFYFIWLLFLKMDIKRKLICAGAYSVVSLTPLLIWLWRNYQITGTLTGYRGGSSTPFFKNLVNFADSISIWFFPVQVPADTRMITVGVLMILGTAWYFRKNLAHIIKDAVPQILLVNWGFILVYVGYLLLISTLVAFDQIHHRFTAPLYIPFVVSVLFAVAQTKKFNIGLKIVGNALVILWLGYLGLNIFDEIKTGLKEGAGSYASDFWQDNEVCRYLNQYPPTGKIYSNFPDAIYLFCGFQASLSPRKHHYRSPDAIAEDIKSWQVELGQIQAVHLVWFTEVGRSFLYGPEELGNYVNLEESAIQPDGILFKVSPLAGLGDSQP
jgi:hypothetical protein